MISEANRIIEGMGASGSCGRAKRKNRAVFRILAAAALLTASVLCAIGMAIIFKK